MLGLLRRSRVCLPLRGTHAESAVRNHDKFGAATSVAQFVGEDLARPEQAVMTDQVDPLAQLDAGGIAGVGDAQHLRQALAGDAQATRIAQRNQPLVAQAAQAIAADRVDPAQRRRDGARVRTHPGGIRQLFLRLVEIALQGGSLGPTRSIRSRPRRCLSMPAAGPGATTTPPDTPPAHRLRFHPAARRPAMRRPGHCGPRPARCDRPARGRPTHRHPPATICATRQRGAVRPATRRGRHHPGPMRRRPARSAPTALAPIAPPARGRPVAGVAMPAAAESRNRQSRTGRRHPVLASVCASQHARLWFRSPPPAVTRSAPGPWHRRR